MGAAESGVACESSPLDLEAAIQEPPPPPTRRGGGPACALRAWRFHCGAEPHITAWESVRIARGVRVRRDSTYLVLLIKRRGARLGCAAEGLGGLSGHLTECCTPRGLTYPFSLSCDLLRPSGEPPRQVVYTVYVFYGRSAPGIAKALALKWALELERRLVEDRDLAEALLEAGSDAFVPSDPLAPPGEGEPASGGAEDPGRELPHLLRVLTAKPPAPLPIPTVSGGVPMIGSVPVTGGASVVGSSGVTVPTLGRGGPREVWGEVPEEKKEQIGEEDETWDDVKEQNKRRAEMAVWRPQCSRITEYMCVGGGVPAVSLQTLLDGGITHVLNAAADVVPSRFPSHFCYLSLRLADAMSEDISAHFVRAVEFIDHVRQAGGRVYVHCQEGVSRSCTLASAYLIWSEGIGKEEAVARVREKRQVCRPNWAFTHRLGEWSDALSGRRAVLFFRLSASSRQGEGSPPLCLAPFRPGGAGEPSSLDPRFSYAVVQGGGGGKVWVWQGKASNAAAADLAAQLAPQDAQFALPTSPELGRDRRVHPPEGVVQVKEGAEPPELTRLFAAGGCKTPTTQHAGYDTSAGLLATALKEWPTWHRTFLESREEGPDAQRVRNRERESGGSEARDEGG
eukprot:Hpha_TRINITY_DN15731_c0_g2::TRINITY_DN15731_c0_g2_i1::g.39653::m.39653